MEFIGTTVAGAYLIRPEARHDARGFFARMWDEGEFSGRGLSTAFVQCNNSFSVHRGTLRGLHYQTVPHAEIKLLRCVRGAVFDVVADARADSPTFGRWCGATVTADDRTMVYVPAGCAHGYLALEDASEVIYLATAAYHPASERGIRWNDPAFQIEWPAVESLLLSDKDRAWPDCRRSAATRS